MLITGRPEPRLLWYEDGRQIEGKIEHLPNQQMRNVLQIEHLNRSNHGVSYVCAVSNSRILSPLLASITILMRCKYYKRKKKRNSLLRPVTSLLKPVTVTSMMDFFILYCPSSLKLKSSRKLAGRCWIAADFNRNQVQIRSLKFIGIEYHIATYLEINTARKEDSISHEKTDKL